MQPAVFRALEFDRIRDVLATRALTPMGRTRLLVLEPATNPAEVRAALDLTLEGVEFERQGGTLDIQAPDDLVTSLAVLHLDAQPLEPLALLGLARFLDSVDRVAASASRTRPTQGSAATSAHRTGSALAAIADGAVSFADETAEVQRAIEPTGDVSDRASAALRDIRTALRRQRGLLRTSLDQLARGRDTAKYLQDQIVTDRNGRYVLVVRSEHRDAIPGLIHGSSASGASLYLEPLATVALNNEVVALVEREKVEIHRILCALTQAFRSRDADLDVTVEAAIAFDVLRAKVDLARRVDGIAPTLTTDNRIDFRGARHPLLIPAVRDLTESSEAGRSIHPVPSDLSLTPPAGALVISGPNTGGKTVALKAFGLLALMAQSGLLVPADPGSSLTPFRTVFADIGDAQSIAASLSTFSAHVARLIQVERTLELPALVLLDEVGSGTDPLEGGALGAAVVDHFRRRGALVVATTHDDAMKSYAATTDGVVTAGFGFHPETYAPTYRLIYGAPGRSLALEIAERLGMPAGVIADARARLSGRESLLAAHLAQLDHAIATATLDRDRLAREREMVALEHTRLLEKESRLAEREAVLKRRLDDRLNEKLREARTEVDRIVGRLRERADVLAQQAELRAAQGAGLSTGEVGSLRAEARTALGSLSEAIEAEAPADHTMLAGVPAVGDSVFVASMNADGVVRQVSNRQVEVDVRGKRLRTRLSDLRQPSASGRRELRDDRRAASRVHVQTATRTEPARELVLVGQTVDAALDRAGKFLDDALLADERRLRVVHGQGTGRLREALTTFFRAHPLVARVSTASDEEGGRAATIVELKD
jgi:DNA mismatch repair protein MutS2